MVICLKESISLELAYSFRKLVQPRHSWVSWLHTGRKLVQPRHIWVSWPHTGRHDAGELVGSSTFGSTGSRKRDLTLLDLTWAFVISKPIPSTLSLTPLSYPRPTHSKAHINLEAEEIE